MTSIPLTHDLPHVDHALGETTVRYTLSRSGLVEFHAFPTRLAGKLAPLPEHETGPHIDHLPAKWQPQAARIEEWLVQCKFAGSPDPGGFQTGMSQRGAEDLNGLSFKKQSATPLPGGGVEIITTLAHTCGAEFRHVVRWHHGELFLRVHTECHNRSENPLTLEFLTSFSLGGITPFQPDEAAELLRLHRFRSMWSAEGRHDAALLEDLSLDRAWINASRRTLRFGQLGSMPVRGFFPFAALEDTDAGVFWGVQTDAPASWHLEVSRIKDKVVLSGGPPCRDFGEWWRTLAPGESFSTPSATLACVTGDIDDLCHALTSAQAQATESQPEIERSLPCVFNEWCTSWGEPNHDYLIATARRLAGTRTKILVIDDGWAEKPPGWDIQYNGDWVVDRKKFPDGLRATTDAVRALGLIPGIWFEMEVATKGTLAHEVTDHQLRRNGRTIQVGNRHFWDFRDPFTRDYLAERLIGRLRDDGFGYLKIDYNDALPAGVDGGESPGGALLEHISAVQDFLRRIRAELPELIIENCSSGGHRLEPSFMAICAQGSFSDAHETLSIPIIAANLHRLILPRQSQIWAVLHADDTFRYLQYKLAATFLGRMCLSGEINDLSDDRLDEIRAAQDFHHAAAPVIRNGRSRLHREMGKSWNQPRGWQAVVRHNEQQTLIVIHRFGGDNAAAIEIPLPDGNWRIHRSYGEAAVLTLTGKRLSLADAPPFSGHAVLLEPA